MLNDFPVKIDYVVLLGDGTPPERAAEFQSIVELFELDIPTCLDRSV